MPEPFNFDLIHEVLHEHWLVENINQIRSGFQTLATIDLLTKLQVAGFVVVPATAVVPGELNYDFLKNEENDSHA